MDSLTTTAESKDCAGSCVHTFATLLCQSVNDEAHCPNNMKCCIETNNTISEDETQQETQRPIRITTTMKPVTKTTQKVEKPTKSDSNKAEGINFINLIISRIQFDSLTFVDF